MASLAGDFLCLATVSMTPDTVGILYQRASGMVVAIRTFLRQPDMLGMVKFEWLIQLALTVQGNRIWNGYSHASAGYCCQQKNKHYTDEPEPLFLHNLHLLYMLNKLYSIGPATKQLMQNFIHSAMKNSLLVASIGGRIIFFLVYISIKHWKPHEEGHTNEVFHAFDVRVIIHQRKNFLEFTY
jgi:hypothetical protein